MNLYKTVFPTMKCVKVYGVLYSKTNSSQDILGYDFDESNNSYRHQWSTKYMYNYTPTRREGATCILQSPCPLVRPFTLSLKMSQLLLEEMILFLIHDFGIVNCTVSPLSRLTAHLLPVYHAT